MTWQNLKIPVISLALFFLVNFFFYHLKWQFCMLCSILFMQVILCIILCIIFERFPQKTCPGAGLVVFILEEGTHFFICTLWRAMVQIWQKPRQVACCNDSMEVSMACLSAFYLPVQNLIHSGSHLLMTHKGRWWPNRCCLSNYFII